MNCGHEIINARNSHRLCALWLGLLFCFVFFNYSQKSHRTRPEHVCSGQCPSDVPMAIKHHHVTNQSICIGSDGNRFVFCFQHKFYLSLASSLSEPVNFRVVNLICSKQIQVLLSNHKTLDKTNNRTEPNRIKSVL